MCVDELGGTQVAFLFGQTTLTFVCWKGPVMNVSLYAISLPPGRLVATELEDAAAAVLFDAGQSILLATLLDLVRLALRENRSLTVFTRDETRGSPWPAPGSGHRRRMLLRLQSSRPRKGEGLGLRRQRP
jgi:hypothetical protein